MLRHIMPLSYVMSEHDKSMSVVVSLVPRLQQHQAAKVFRGLTD